MKYYGYACEDVALNLTIKRYQYRPRPTAIVAGANIETPN